jgi:hypothetical protein
MKAIRMCYARILGGCSAGLSREHYISRAVLDQLGAIYIEGLGRTPDGGYSSTSLTAKVLCRSHNSELHRLDTEAGQAFRLLRDLQTSLDVGSPPAPLRTERVDGLLFERWFLKLALGLIASGQIGMRDQNVKIAAVRPGYELTLLKIAFGQQDWPAKWGLYLDSVDGQSFCAPTTKDDSTAEFGAEPLTNAADNTLWGLRVWIRSFPFLLAFGKPDYLESTMHRPGVLVLDDPTQRNANTIELSWGDDGQHHETLHLSRIGTHDAT